MSKKEQLNELQARQVELLAIAKKSDAHAAKCTKRGLMFEDTYPNDYTEYTEAMSEYNENKVTIADLVQEIAEEEAVDMLARQSPAE